jgi:hypothetical protein
MNKSDILTLILEKLQNYGTAILIILGAFISVGLIFVIFKAGKMFIYRGGFGAKFDHNPWVKRPYKGYKPWRSAKWNMENTA